MALAVAGAGGAGAPVPAVPPVVWRLCAGTEGSVTVPLPAADGTPAALLRLSQPLTGFHLTAERVRSATGGDRLLLDLTAPAAARPGRYSGVLTVRRGAAASRSPAVVEVLPFELMRPSKQYAVTEVPVGARGCCAPEAAGVDALRELRALGIGALCLTAAPADPTALVSAMRAAGLHGPVLAPVAPPTDPSGTGVSGTNATASAASPPSASPPPSAASIRWYAWFAGGLPAPGMMATLRAEGARVACHLDDPAAAGEIDLPVFDAAGASGARLLHAGGPPGARAAGWWSWDADTATPLESRLRCGALLWKSGLSGALVEIGPEAAGSPHWPLRWEGIRQGVLDSRYLTTLFALIRQVKDKDRALPMPGQAEVAVAAALNGVAEHPSPEAADRVRSLVIAWILKLARMV